MLLEFFTWLTTTSAPSARKAGLVVEVAGIAGRCKRNQKAWLPHLNQTKSFIESHIEKVDPNKPILVLGAGLSLDLPLKALNKHPAGAILLDAVLPVRTRLQLLKFPNLRFTCTDITGFLELFWNGASDHAITPPEIAPITDDDFGMIVSCNLLSQLALSFTSSPPANDIENQIMAAIQLAHMRTLNEHKCPIILVTDYERIETSDNIHTTIPTVAPQLLPGEPHQLWEWHIAPDGEVRMGLDVKLKVGAWLLSSL